MPGIAHETPIELLRQNPLLAAALLQGTGVDVPGGLSAVMAAGDLSSALPAELRADVVIVLDGHGAGPGMQPGKLAVVVEVQTAPDGEAPGVAGVPDPGPRPARLTGGAG